MGDRVRIEIVSWAHYNPRSDRGGFSWFRMDNQFYLHMRQRKGLSASATVLMGFLLAEASSNNGEAFELRVAFAAEMLGRKVSEITAAIEELVSAGEIRVVSEAPETVSQPDPTIKPLQAAFTLTDGRTDGRTVSATAPSAPALPPLAELWNKHRGKLPEVRGASGTRKRQAESRWREKPDPDYWREVIVRIVTSPFCSGENDRGWRADFDFLIKPETQHRVREGKYDARGGPAASAPLKTLDDLKAEEAGP